MRTTSPKRPIAAAEREAHAFRELFAGCFLRWEIAGSVRRRVTTVGDVEHVVVPRVVDVPTNESLFAETRSANLLMERADELVRTYVLTKHVYGANADGSPKFKWGPKARGVEFRGFTHEIYSADAINWGSVLAIRTGPGTYSRMLVTKLQSNGYMNDEGYVWNKSDMACADCGWRGAFAGERGLLFIAPEDWEAAIRTATGADSGGKPVKPKFINGRDRAGVCPICRRQDGLSMKRVDAPDEGTYFDLCGVKWAEPWERFDIQQGRRW